jgi:hypothetical protein
MATKTKGEEAEKPRYVVVEPLQHDGASYTPGDEIDLDESAAQALLMAGVIMIGLPIAPKPTDVE